MRWYGHVRSLGARNTNITLNETKKPYCPEQALTRTATLGQGEGCGECVQVHYEKHPGRCAPCRGVERADVEPPRGVAQPRGLQLPPQLAPAAAALSVRVLVASAAAQGLPFSVFPQLNFKQFVSETTSVPPNTYLDDA